VRQATLLERLHAAPAWGIAGVLAIACAQAAEVGPSEHRGHVSVDYQFVHVDGFEASTGKRDIGTTDSHSLHFELGYALTDRLTLSVGLPLVRKRYKGDAPHDPLSIVPPADQENIDDGKYRTEFQDWHFGASYRAWETASFSVSPFVAFGIPSNDYPFFAHAAVGQNLWKFDVGAELMYVPALYYFYARLAPSYVFVEETKGVNIDHWRINGEVGYFFNDRISGKVFTIVKEGHGLRSPEDFPVRNDDFWFHHDQMIKHNFVNAGLGLDWQITPIHRVNVSWMTMVHADNVHIMKYALTLGWSTSF